MDYLQLEIHFNNKEWEEIFLAELAECGFSSFSTEENILRAYIPQNDYDEMMLDGCYFLSAQKENISLQKRIIKAENWNRKWEENFDPVCVANQIYIRAPFHAARPDVPIEILIMPKMAFGTGHHATTYLMLSQMLELDLNDKSVADLGCGSGILAIAASKLNAGEITAVDIDEWSYNNSIENAAVNNVKNIIIKQGSAHILKQKFDVVLANINRNVLLAEMNIYSRLIVKNGLLLISGFYVEDKETVNSAALEEGFIFITEMEKDNWLSILYQKK